MLTLDISPKEFWDEKNERFVNSKAVTLHFEHTLVSVSKWEMKYKKSFFVEKQKTREESNDYIHMMCLDEYIPPLAIEGLSAAEQQKINDYINDTMTAATFPKEEKTGNKNEILTTDVIYYWMVSYRIPAEYQYWHLNRLLALIHTCSVKQEKESKMSKKDVAKRNRSLNARRRAAMHSRG